MMRRGLTALGGGLLVLGCFGTVLTVGVPAAFDLEMHGGSVPVAPAVCFALLALLLLAAFTRSGRVSTTLACAVTLVLFAVPLSAVWQSGRSSGSHIAGLLPFNDAAMYYHCALLLTEGESLQWSPAVDAFCSRRPMFMGALAGVLFLTGQDLRWALALLVLAAALCCFVATLEVRQALGPPGAALFLLILAFFHRRYAGTVLTEHLGLALGALGFAGLWRSARTGGIGAALWGLFLLSLALNARAGAFLTLPAALVWAAWRFRHARSPSTTFALGATVVGVGFALNALLVRAVGTPAGLFSNFSYSLYGLVFGGDWTLALADHPRLSALPELERANQILHLAVEGIRREPGRLLAGASRAWGEFLGTPYPFVFVHRGLVNLALRLMAALGVVACLLRRRDPIPSLLLALLLGLVASVPFVPPWDADLMRVYAATMPVLAAVAALGPSAMARWLGVGRRAEASSVNARTPTGLYGLGLALVTLTFLSPALLKIGPGPSQLASAGSACREPLHVRPPRGNMVTVVPDATGSRYPGTLALADYRRGFRSIAPIYPDLVRVLTDASAPFVLLETLSLEPLRPVIVIAPLALVPPRTERAKVWRICGEPGEGFLLHARSIEPLAT